MTDVMQSVEPHLSPLTLSTSCVIQNSQLKALGLKVSDMITARRMSEVKSTELAHQLEVARSNEAAVADELAAREMERSAAMEEAEAATVAREEAKARLREEEARALERTSEFSEQLRQAEAATYALEARESAWQTDRELLEGQAAVATEELASVRASLEPKVTDLERELRTSELEKEVLSTKLSSALGDLEGFIEELRVAKVRQHPLLVIAWRTWPRAHLTH